MKLLFFFLIIWKGGVKLMSTFNKLFLKTKLAKNNSVNQSLRLFFHMNVMYLSLQVHYI